MSVWTFRDENTRRYDISGPMLNPWTSTPVIVEIVLDFFNLSVELLNKIPPESEDDTIRETRSKLPSLAGSVFRCFQERLSWLER